MEYIFLQHEPKRDCCHLQKKILIHPSPIRDSIIATHLFNKVQYYCIIGGATPFGMFHFRYRDMSLFAFREFNFNYCQFACGIVHSQLEI